MYNVFEKISELRKGIICVRIRKFTTRVSPSILIEISRICFEKQVFLILTVVMKKFLDCLPYQPFY